MRLHYPVIITANDGAYSAVFPDFPDASADADSVSEIMVAIDDALQEAVTIAVLKGEMLPDPSPFEQALSYDDDNASWWTMAHCDLPSDNENFDRIMSGLHEIEQEFMKKPVLVVGLETGPTVAEAETALSQASLDALIDKHRDELLANPPTNKFWLDETALGVKPREW